MPKFRMSGIDEMKAKLRLVMEKYPKKLAAAMYREAQVEMTESKKRCPVDTGVLRASGFVDNPVIEPKRVAVTLGYGGAASDYALVQHEDLDLLHPVGQAKFLESVLMESASDMAGRIAARAHLSELEL